MSVPPVSAATDAQLMAQVARGDVEAFRVVYDRYRIPAYSVAQRIAGQPEIAEEATQDAFLSLWRNAGRYDPQRASLRSWVISIASHRTIDALRQRKARGLSQQLPEEALERVASPAAHTEEHVLAGERAEQMRKLVAALPAEQRRIIELAYFRGYTQQEIANGTGIPLGTVKSRARVALAKLRETSPVMALSQAA